MAPSTWETPFGDLEIRDIAASGDTLVAAGSSAGVEVEARSARSDGERFVEVRRIAVPHRADVGEIRPWLSLDQRGARRSLAVNLEESQGGSWGVVVVPDLDQAQRETIANPTHESDIGFAAPLLLRGDTLLARGAFELRCFERAGPGRWAERLLLPSGGSTDVEWSWALDLSPSGDVWMAGRAGEGAHLVILERSRGAFEITTRLPMEHEPMAIAFLSDDEALVGSASAWRDGTSLRFVRRTAAGWAWGRALSVPLEPNGWAVSQIAPVGRRAVITQQDSAWRVDLETGASTPVALPPRQGAGAREPQARAMGRHVVLRVGDQLCAIDV